MSIQKHLTVSIMDPDPKEKTAVLKLTKGLAGQVVIDTMGAQKISVNKQDLGEAVLALDEFYEEKHDNFRPIHNIEYNKDAEPPTTIIPVVVKEELPVMVWGDEN